MLGNSLKGSGSSLLSVHSVSELGGEKPQLPWGNTEPLNALKMSTAHGLQPESKQRGANAHSIYQWI